MIAIKKALALAGAFLFYKVLFTPVRFPKPDRCYCIIGLQFSVFPDDRRF